MKFWWLIKCKKIYRLHWLSLSLSLSLFVAFFFHGLGARYPRFPASAFSSLSLCRLPAPFRARKQEPGAAAAASVRCKVSKVSRGRGVGGSGNRLGAEALAVLCALYARGKAECSWFSLPFPKVFFFLRLGFFHLWYFFISRVVVPVGWEQLADNSWLRVVDRWVVCEVNDCKFVIYLQEISWVYLWEILVLYLERFRLNIKIVSL